MRWKQLIFALLMIPAAVVAQTEDACPVIVRTALDLTRTNCDGTALNEACYGHILLDAQARPDVEAFQFDQPGDIVDLLEVESMRLSAMDTQLGQWGVLLMEVEAEVRRLTESLTDDAATPASDEPTLLDVQMLLFGDVQLNDANRFIQLVASEETSIYLQPDEDSGDIGTLDEGARIIANARLADSDWLRVRFSDAVTGLGWVRATDFVPNENIQYLEELTPDEAGTIPEDARARFGPMQAFTIQTGRDDAPCAEAPNSGLLIQTPEGAAAVSLWLDEVVIQMDATAFVQATPGGDLTIDVLEGSVSAEAFGDTQVAYEGTRITIPLDDEAAAAGAPEELSAMDADAVQSLPVGLLDNPVEIPTPFEPNSGQPVSGDWAFQWGVSELTCPDGTTVPFVSDGTPATITLQDQGLLLSGTPYTAQGSGIYRGTYTDANGNLHQDTLRVVSHDRIEGEKVLDLVSPVCTLNVPFSLSLMSPFD